MGQISGGGGEASSGPKKGDECPVCGGGDSTWFKYYDKKTWSYNIVCGTVTPFAICFQVIIPFGITLE